jgi:secreted trypsin-like serine protease
MCGGSLLDQKQFENSVLTAASCFGTIDPASLRVAIGGGGARGDGALFGVASLEFHPLFNAETNAFNVALVRLSGEVEASEEGKFIKFENAVRAEPGSQVTFVGYGDKYLDGGVVDALKHTGEATGHEFRVLGWGHYECKSELMKQGLEHPGCISFCVKQVSAGGPCVNDVGGAVFSKGMLTGLTSMHGECGKKGKVSTANTSIQFP